jgi:hypothetical protein
MQESWNVFDAMVDTEPVAPSRVHPLAMTIADCHRSWRIVQRGWDVPVPAQLFHDKRFAHTLKRTDSLEPDCSWPKSDYAALVDRVCAAYRPLIGLPTVLTDLVLDYVVYRGGSARGFAPPPQSGNL